MAPEITAPGDKEACQHDGENRGEARAEAGPVEVDQGEAVIGLIQRHFAGFIGDIIFKGELSVILDIDDGELGRMLSRVPVFCEVLLNQLLVFDVVDEVLSMIEETKGRHNDGEVVDFEEDGERDD